MTEKFRYLFLFLLVVLLTSCHKADKRQLTLWNEIESQMSHHPDTALQLLKHISPDTLQLPDRMYYDLLLTQANDKNYIDHTSDSLILNVVSYYNSVKAPIYLRLQANYYLARVYHDMDSLSLAIKGYMTVNKMAMDMNQTEYITLASNNLGRILANNGLLDEADACFKKAQEYIEIEGDTLRLFVVLINRAYINIKSGKEYYTEAESKLERAYSLSENLDNMFRQRLFVAYASLYKLIPDNRKTITWQKASIAIQEDTMKHHRSHLMIGQAYDLLQQYDSAMYYLSKSVLSDENNIKRDGYSMLVDVARKRGMYKDALCWYDSCMKYTQLTEANNKTVKVITNLKDIVHQEEITQFMAKSRINQIRLWSLIVVFVILLLILLYRYLKARKKALQYINEMEQIKKGFNEKTNEIQRLHNLLIECEDDKVEMLYLKKQIETVMADRNSYFSHILPGLSSYRKLQDLISHSDKLKLSEENITPKLWNDIEFELDCVTDSFTNRLSKKYQDLKPADIRFCCLLKMGFRYKDMALLLGRTSRMMYNRRSKIAQIINADNDFNLEDFIDRF